MAKQPFSAPRPRSLPTYTPSADITQTLQNWQAQLTPLIQNVAPQATPQNFSITNSRGGLTLNWSPVAGGDGYEILKSVKGSFADDLQIIPVKNANQSNFFDALGGNSTTAHYRIRTTSGTASNPQSQRGPESGVIKHTSIDAADTTSTPVTVFDNFTTDKTRSLARLGNYGGIKLTPLGQAGGSKIGNGAKSPVGSTQAAQAVTSFATIGTGKNTKGVLTVAGGAKIIPDPNNPGVIDATQLQGTNVSTTGPTNGQIPQYSSASGALVYATIIATGLQSALPSVLPLGIGEIYVATDTGNLFVGTPGVGLGYLQVGDTSQVNDLLNKILLEMRATRLALSKLACEGGLAVPSDFDPQLLAADPEVAADQN